MSANQQRGNPTKPERIGYALLDALGVDYFPQYVIAGKFCVDAFVPALGIVIQFDGDYWHGNPSCYAVLDTRQQRRVYLDQSQDAYMQTCGFTIIRIWASTLQQDPEQVRSRLQACVVPV